MTRTGSLKVNLHQGQDTNLSLGLKVKPTLFYLALVPNHLNHSFFKIYFTILYMCDVFFFCI